MNRQDVEQEFAAELEARGYGQQHIPADGKWHDFRLPDHKRGKKSGAAKLTNGEYPDGVMIDRRKGRDPQLVWRPNGTPADAPRLKLYDDFNALPDATADHPYLIKKGITDPRPLKLDGNVLVAPICNAGTGKFQTVQRIWPDGRKRFPKGATTHAGYILPGERVVVDDSTVVIIAEGYATAAAIRAANFYPVLAALDCGNLAAVAKAMRARFPQREIILAADNDDQTEGNPGVTLAKQAARTVGGKVAIPPPGDFNDLLLAKGQQAVADAINNAATPEPETEEEQGPLSLEHFWSFGPMNQFFFMPSLTLWPASSVDARLVPVKVCNADGSTKLNKKGNPIYIAASTWLSRNRSVETMTWAPGHDAIVYDKTMVDNGGLIDTPGFRCFNTYRAPPPITGDPTKANRWVELVKKLYPGEADEIFNYAAQRVQRPAEKINHCLVLTGQSGIGKDTIIAPILRAVGTWNCSEASPEEFFEAFNSHAKAVIMRINECHDLGDASKFSFYERTKIYAAAPPETLPVNDKYIRKYYIPNVCGIIMTSNYRTDCLYLPADDRRHFVAWSEISKDDFEANFWIEFWRWLNYEDGNQHVAAWLNARDLSGFDPKATPRKTAAFWAIVEAGRTPEENQIMDVLDALENPDAVTIQMIKDHVKPKHPSYAGCELHDWFSDPRNVKQYSRRMEKCEYLPVPNEGAKDRCWKVGGKRQVVYAKKTLTTADQLGAVNALCGEKPPEKPVADDDIPF